MQYPHEFVSDTSRQLVLEIDGLPLRDGSAAVYTIQSVISSLSDQDRELLKQLRGVIGLEIGIIDRHFDDVSTLIGQLGFKPRAIAGEDLGETDLRVVAIGCPHRHTRLDQIDATSFLRRGGVLLSSDKAIRLPGISAFVEHAPGRAPAQVRLCKVTGGADDRAMLPAVWLDPGHLPIAPNARRSPDVTTLAFDPMTGQPLVIAVQVDDGVIIHSVPHWLQIPYENALTSVERRPLRDVPQYRHLGNTFPGVTLGAFLAQRAMIDLLLQGLASVTSTTVTAEQRSIEQEQ